MPETHVAASLHLHTLCGSTLPTQYPRHCRAGVVSSNMVGAVEQAYIAVTPESEAQSGEINADMTTCAANVAVKFSP